MGNYICALIILVFVFVFTGVNSYIICGMCDEMIAHIDSGDTEKAISLWEEKCGYISIFVRDAEIDAVNVAAAGESDEERFKSALEEIKNSEHPSIMNIFSVDINV